MEKISFEEFLLREGRYNGVVFDEYEDGEIIFTTYTNRVPNGKIWREKNGKLLFEGNMKNGLRDGIEKDYSNDNFNVIYIYENGKLLSIKKEKK